MTREEAIEIIKAYREKLNNSVSNQLDGDIKALDMAISALEQEPCDVYEERGLKADTVIIDEEAKMESEVNNG